MQVGSTWQLRLRTYREFKSRPLLTERNSHHSCRQISFESRLLPASAGLRPPMSGKAMPFRCGTTSLAAAPPVRRRSLLKIEQSLPERRSLSAHRAAQPRTCRLKAGLKTKPGECRDDYIAQNKTCHSEFLSPVFFDATRGRPDTATRRIDHRVSASHLLRVAWNNRRNHAIQKTIG